MFRRRGGLVRAAATTAVVAGTAGAVRHHQDQKYAAPGPGGAGAAAAIAAQPTYAAPPPAAPRRAGLHGRAVAARPAQGAGDHHRRGVRGEEEAAPRASRTSVRGRPGRFAASARPAAVRATTDPTTHNRRRPGRHGLRRARKHGCRRWIPRPDREAPARTPAPASRAAVDSRRGSSSSSAILFLVVSLLSNFVKREALDEDNFRNTSEELIANDVIRDQLALTMVETLYTNVDVSAAARGSAAEEPPAASRARSPASHATSPTARRARCSTAARRSSSSSRSRLTAQQSWSRCSRRHAERLDTTDGNVVLDIRPLVLRLGDRFQFISNLAHRVPEDSAKITLLQSDHLATAQNLTQWLKAMANWIWILVIVCWAAAIWLVPAVAAVSCARSASGWSSSACCCS